jgi:hypothetical protein
VKAKIRVNEAIDFGSILGFKKGRKKFEINEELDVPIPGPSGRLILRLLGSFPCKSTNVCKSYPDYCLSVSIYLTYFEHMYCYPALL